MTFKNWQFSVRIWTQTVMKVRSNTDHVFSFHLHAWSKKLDKWFLRECARFFTVRILLPYFNRSQISLQNCSFCVFLVFPSQNMQSTRNNFVWRSVIRCRTFWGKVDQEITIILMKLCQEYLELFLMLDECHVHWNVIRHCSHEGEFCSRQTLAFL